MISLSLRDMKCSNLYKLTLFSLLLLSVRVAKGQVEYRVGLGLYERTWVSLSGGVSYPVGSMTAVQVCNSYFVERQKGRVSHRITGRYINQKHNLKKRVFRPGLGGGYTGEPFDFERSEWNLGYSFLYSWGKKMRFSTGLGISYLQDKQKSYAYGTDYIDFTNQAIAPSFILEGNFNIFENWYVSPAMQFMVPLYYKSVNGASSNTYNYTWPEQFYITPFKLSVKRTVYKN
jgi:hypothetical protein